MHLCANVCFACMYFCLRLFYLAGVSLTAACYRKRTHQIPNCMRVSVFERVFLCTRLVEDVCFVSFFRLSACLSERDYL